MNKNSKKVFYFIKVKGWEIILMVPIFLASTRKIIFAILASIINVLVKWLYQKKGKNK